MEQEQRLLKNAKCFGVTIDSWNVRRRHLSTLGDVGGLIWRAEIEKFSEDGVDYLSLGADSSSAVVPFNYWFENFFVEMAICVKNENPERWEKCQKRFHVEWRKCIGWKKFMRMDTILNPDSGFLRDDGSLRIQVEIRLDYFIYYDGTKCLNFSDPFEGSVRVEFASDHFYAHKRMLMFHSPVFAKKLAAGTDKVVISNLSLKGATDSFLQLIHGVKVKTSEDNILDVLYFAHKFQVVTVLRQLEIHIKNCSDEDIHNVCIRKDTDWIKTLIGRKHVKFVRKMIKVWDDWYSEEYKQLNDRKREMLLAITRAPFTHDLDLSFIFRFLSKPFKKIITCVQVNKV